MNALISGAPSSRSPGPGGHDVRARLPGVGDESLAAIEHPAPAVGPILEPGDGPRPARIAAGAGLGQAVRADHPPGGHRDQEPLLLLGRTGQVERAAAQARVGRHDQPERAPDPSDLLDRDGVGQGVEPGARPRPRGSGCRASRARRSGGPPRSGSVAHARARRRAGATSSTMNVADRVAQQPVLGGRSRSMSGSLHRDSGPPPPVLACRHGRAPTVGSGGPSCVVSSTGRQRTIEPPAGPAAAAAGRWPEHARPAGRPTRRQPDRRPPAAAGARGCPPGQPPDDPPRRRPTAPPVRHHRGCSGSLPVRVRGPGGRVARGDRSRRRERSARRGLRRPLSPARQARPPGHGRARRRRRPAARPGAGAGRDPDLARLPGRRGHQPRWHDPAPGAQLRDLPHRRRLAGGLPGRARAVQRRPGRGRGARAAHRVGRPMLLLQDQRAGDPRPPRARRRRATPAPPGRRARPTRSGRTMRPAPSRPPAPGPPPTGSRAGRAVPSRRGCTS